MKKTTKILLACALALTVSVPVLGIPSLAEAAPTKKATAKKASYTAAERAYIQYNTDMLKKLGTQVDDMTLLLMKVEQYENNEEEFYTLVMNKLAAWEKTYKQGNKYRPQDVPAKLKKAHTSYTQAMQQQGLAIQLMKKALDENTSDAETDAAMETFFKAIETFGKHKLASAAEIKRLNAIYQ